MSLSFGTPHLVVHSRKCSSCSVTLDHPGKAVMTAGVRTPLTKPEPFSSFLWSGHRGGQRLCVSAAGTAENKVSVLLWVVLMLFVS